MSGDEEFLIAQVLGRLKTDIAAAKSWMLFAKSSFPQSFTVLFQAYRMEVEERNLQESALCLGELVRKFPNETVLVTELRSTAKSLCSDTNHFSKQVFEQLPEELRYEAMVAVTRNAPTVEDHCELTLLFLRRAPSARMLAHAHSVVETLVAAEERPGIRSPLNPFRKMLVCDALPLILNSPQLDYKFKVAFQLLQKAVEFYVCGMFCAHDSTIWREAMAEQPDEDGWKPLLRMLENIALRYKWHYPELLVSQFSDLSLQQLVSLLRRRNRMLAGTDKHRRTGATDDSSGHEEAYFCLTTAFFYYLHHFGRQVLGKSACNYVLMEGVVVPQEENSRPLGSEFRRTERGYLAVSGEPNTKDEGLLLASFATAVESWELLHRHPMLAKDFKSLCKGLQLDTWPFFQEFYVDMLMYERAHRDAIEHLTRLREASTSSLKVALQVASCHHFLGENEMALKMLFDVIAGMPPDAAASITKPVLGRCPTRFMFFMPYTRQEVLRYCVGLLLQLYKGKERADDMTLGFMLVLMQVDLPREYALLHRCIDTIKKNKSFCFPKFFNYVINVEILEEVSYLASVPGGYVNLEIVSTPTFAATKQRAVTRGVNKGARDDLRQAFVTQMARCYDNLDDLFAEFIKEEQSLILLSLSE